MQNDEEWKDAVIDPVNVLGVNNISFNGIEILLWFKTEPGTQFALGREFRRRLKYAFDRENIDIGIPQHSLQLENSPALTHFVLNEWSKLDKKLYKKIVELTKDIDRSPFTGLRKPESLKHELAGFWTRRINEEHRLVYTINDTEITIAACKYHYE